jgi:flagellar assembly factor FliW
MKQKPKPDVVSIFHRNVKCVNNKLLELNLLLQSESDVDVLCVITLAKGRVNEINYY